MSDDNKIGSIVNWSSFDIDPWYICSKNCGLVDFIGLLIMIAACPSSAPNNDALITSWNIGLPSMSFSVISWASFSSIKFPLLSKSNAAASTVI